MVAIELSHTYPLFRHYLAEPMVRWLGMRQAIEVDHKYLLESE
jgi:hypothetical protein